MVVGSTHGQTASTANTGNSTPNGGNSKGRAFFSLPWGFHSSEDHSQLQMQIEYGHIFSEIPLFITPGLGYKNSTVWVATSSSPYYTNKKKYDFNYITIPIQLGYLIGDIEKIHASISGGAAWNYLISGKYDGSSLDLDGYKRSTWNGSLRFALGWKEYGIMAQYDFPFSSDSDGIWLFGICFQGAI